VSLLDLEMRMGGRPLLDIARFELPTASCTVLSGRNGAGKTTLLKIAAGLLRPDALRICSGGAVLDWAAGRSVLRTHSIYMHQHAYMFDRDVSANVAYGLRRGGAPASECAKAVRTALEWAGLDHLAGRNARHLSGGERQRLALARARVLSPEVLLLDEPTTNMDEEATEQSLFLIRRMVSEGMGIVVASHDRRIVGQLADRHLNLADGALHEVDGGARPDADAPAYASGGEVL
jgi:tungstate transport system ATP-binding protein